MVLADQDWHQTVSQVPQEKKSSFSRLNIMLFSKFLKIIANISNLFDE